MYKECIQRLFRLECKGPAAVFFLSLQTVTLYPTANPVTNVIQIPNILCCMTEFNVYMPTPKKAVRTKTQCDHKKKNKCKAVK